VNVERMTSRPESFARRAVALSIASMKPHHTPMHVTPLATRAPCAMLVNVPSDALDDVVTVLQPLLILKVAHVPAACERMVATWPLVVVLGSQPKESEFEAIRATALDISAQIVIVSNFPDRARLRLELAAAKKAATEMRTETPSRP
jgi:hypothetical protein